jgi:hypothetical protein
MQIIHSPFLIGPFHFDFGYVWRLLVEIARGKLQKRFTIRLFYDGSFDDERPNVLEEVTFVLVLELKLRQLLGVQVLEELCVVSLKNALW